MSKETKCPRCGAGWDDETGLLCGSVQWCDAEMIPDDGSEPVWEFTQSLKCRNSELEQRVDHLEQVCESAHYFLSTMKVPQTAADVRLQILVGGPVLKKLAGVVEERKARTCLTSG